MAFPMPLDPFYRKEIILSWLDDVGDRLDMDDPEAANLSLKTAEALYLGLPPGSGCFLIEERILQSRVKIEQHSPKTICEQSLKNPYKPLHVPRN